MSPAPRGRLGGVQPAVAIAFVVATVVALVVGAVSARGHATDATAAASGTALTTSGVGAPPRWADGRVAVPTRWTGPQGGVGQFVAKCLYSHALPDDPIVWPGRPGRSHLHDFYGATGANARSTAQSLAGNGSTCDKPGDDAAYWQPALYDHGVAVTPIEAHAYYRAAPGVDPASVQPFPPGLAMIAGDALATRPQAGEAAGWTCGVRTALDPTPPACDSTALLHLVLTFPDCWDGVHTDLPGHRAQVTYSEHGRCPSTHPVPLPQLTLTVTFPIWGTGHDLYLASGSIYSAHGDFLNAWNPDALAREIDHCIRNGVMCDVASDREQVPPFFTQ